MSQHIDLGRAPKSLQERLSLLQGHIDNECALEDEGLNLIQQRVIDFLVSEKGYPRECIYANKTFRVKLPEQEFDVKGDLAVVIEGKTVMVIKCAVNSIESWERYSLAFGRTAQIEAQIPFAVVTDSEGYIVIDVLKGEVKGTERGDVPSFNEITPLLYATETPPYTGIRLEREKRILHAFNALRCSAGDCD